MTSTLQDLSMAQLATVAHTIAREPLERTLVRQEITERLRAVLPDRKGPRANSALQHVSTLPGFKS